MLESGPPGAYGYQSYPLPGSPARRLHDEAARLLGSGELSRCPHPDQPVFWYLPAEVLACAPCLDQLLAAAGSSGTVCQACAAPASAIAAWTVGDVPCVAGLCDGCRQTGLVPLAPN